ncbi:ATPase component of Mn/Zn ABC-type transporter [Bernardetia litoralis DSM 6794]|uniref:ATPase component of Mn/Zn ABC-type transporter n=1 Tax=Bernardetia litoralis (strain ATCC 23117 / DSM 6794 / NBRC 15988 / NCIMB 1366 / Fx l1 / Sio-4) TaxID=880071 RepID=I4AI52_BERLS|nr:metal ABC transporter ATP-binding protein [Bernardetia litoralis]AFM03637.1 ATPase component of Mn/Zn ABC-type transporter [Bernardetia litoralis DSM 6794]
MITQVENPVLEIHDLTVSYERKPVLWNIDLSIPKGSLVGIIGPNGAGKSTLIKAVMGLLPLSSGYVKLLDKNLNEVRDKISYVPQRESVDWDFPISVFEVVLMGRYGKMGLMRRPSKKDKEVALQSLEQVGMSAFASRQISQLSGGQQQRVFLARALAQEADLYLMDEPFVGVDAATESAIITLLRDMRAAGKTVIVVHHDLQSAAEYFDWVVLLNMRLVASGETKTTLTPSLLEETYGGRLTVLSEVGELLKKAQFPSRED